MKLGWLAGPAVAALLPATPSFAQCEISAKIQQYLAANPAWTLVQLSTLVPDDQALWPKMRGGQCPGIVTVNFTGKGSSQAITLVKIVRGKWHQRVVLLEGRSPRILAPDDEVGFPNVIWKTGPGRYVDFNTGKTTRIHHDGVVLVALEAGAVVLYDQNGTTSGVQIDD
jgi:hypothetical protein